MSELSPQAMPRPPAPPQVTVEVFAAWQFPAIDGACQGAGLGPVPSAVPGDHYRLAPGATPATLALEIAQGRPRVGTGGAVGRPGQPLRIEGEHHLVADDGETVTVLALRAGEADRVVLPLSPLARGVDYTLMNSCPPTGDLPLPQRIAAAFVRGTAIVLADGTPCPVERLGPGEMILTRDHGPRPLRALLRARMRAAGDQAPVVIAPGTIGNAAELAVSPYHRILLHRPGGDDLPGGAGCFVQARHLVDGALIRRREAGFVDYLSLVFDGHEVIYAEGFPCESLCLTPAVSARLPGAMAADIAARLPGRVHSPRPTRESTRPDLGPFRG